MKVTTTLLAACFSIAGPMTNSKAHSGETTSASNEKTFDSAASFVQQRVPTVILTEKLSGAKVLVAPTLQGRVLSSSMGGKTDPSFGWINYKLIASGKLQPHINAFGGEDRVWLGPEGGQFGLYFPPGAPFDIAHWQTPAPIDTEPFQIVKQQPGEVFLRKDFHLLNYSKTPFDVRIDRKIRILSCATIWNDLHLSAQKDVRTVGYESENRLVNMGKTPWRKESGLLSIWILGQFNASPKATVMIPYRQGPVSKLGPVVESDYFGSVPPDRLQASNGIIYFKADAGYRSKIGLSPDRATSVMGSYDAENHLLTIVQCSAPEAHKGYVNSQWKIQSHPYSGSALNSYNDGPNDTGTRLGNFYEMESSSPALQLSPGQSGVHFQRTIHLTGNPTKLAAIAKKVLGVDLQALPTIFPSKLSENR